VLKLATGEVPFALWFVLGMSAALLVAVHVKAIGRAQERFSQLLEWLIEKTYAPVLRAALEKKWVTLAAAAACLVASCGLVAGGRIETTVFPRIDSAVVVAQLRMPVGTPAAQTEANQEALVESSRQAIERLGGGEATVRG